MLSEMTWPLGLSKSHSLAGWQVAGGQEEKPDIRTSQDSTSAPSFQDSVYTHTYHICIYEDTLVQEKGIM